jgi:hypothetical protein
MSPDQVNDGMGKIKAGSSRDGAVLECQASLKLRKRECPIMSILSIRAGNTPTHFGHAFISRIYGT